MCTEQQFSPPPDTRETEFQDLGQQTFIVDPEFQGFGLRYIGSGYSNKFFMLSSSGGVYISAETVPPALLQYYDNVGIDVARPEDTIALPRTAEDFDKSLLKRAADDEYTRSLLAARGGTILVPYMITPEVGEFAEAHQLSLLASAKDTRHIANKARLQEDLEARRDEIRRDTGYDVVIPSIVTRQGEIGVIDKAYDALSERERRAVVVTKPESASAMGVFVHTPEHGRDGFDRILRTHFSDGEEVLLRQFYEHNHSPSLQGARLPHGEYNHLYIGRQLISYTTSDDGRKVTYDSNQVPFSKAVVGVQPEALASLEQISRHLGNSILAPRNIAGIAGFDTVAVLNEDGHLESVGVTEVNLHLPGSIASFAAIQKVFPQGFNGIAHNFRFAIRAGTTVDEFLLANQSMVVRKQGDYGVFPINASYADRIDIIIFAEDADHLHALQSQLRI